ncbi:MAG TPA: outer membrane lipoprotein carrier protein LolA [Bacteroidales bacterium]|nr:outer membrane lipoprotein carrier protein LolA [Bacteroidales bacterium]
MRNALKEVRTLTCDFQQEREVSVLTEKGISRGTLVYQKDVALLWQYNMPDRSGFLVRNNEWILLGRDGEPVNDNGAGGLFRQIGNIVLMGLNGDILDENEDFKPQYVNGGDFLHVKLKPVKKDLKRLFSELELFFRKEDYMIQTVVIHEMSGDKTTVRMGNIRVNLPVEEKMFHSYVSK